MIDETILANLPTQSRDKLERLITDRAAAYHAYTAASDRAMETRTELGRLHGIVQHQLANAGFVSPEAHPATAIAAQRKAMRDAPITVKMAMKPVEAAERRLKLAEEARERAAAKMNDFTFLGEVETWLKRTATPGGEFRSAQIEMPKVRDPIAEIGKVRKQIEAIADKWAAAEAAPTPAIVLKSRAFKEIDSIADVGAPRLTEHNRSHEPLGLAHKLAVNTRAGAEGTTSIIGDAGASFLIWLMRDELKEKIGKMIDGLSFQGAMSDEDREKAFSEISEQRLNLERTEEALIELAEADGRSIARRPDADPRAILGIVA